jgi:hypothetical protein
MRTLFPTNWIHLIATVLAGEGLIMDRRKLCILVVCFVACALQTRPGSILIAQSAHATAVALKQEAADDTMVKNAGQNAIPNNAGQDAIVSNAAQKNVGIQMTVVSNVEDVADIQAVLIPASLARKIFGKEVANNYAVVEVIVANNDTKASMVVQSLFLDYSDWALSGHLPNQKSTQKNQKPNEPSQVASIESRLVRGELLDAQKWTWRNWTMRTLTFLGTAGVAFEFPFSPDVVKGIGAFNGTVVPGAATLWPDGTTDQINRISDFGFQTNKIIGKQSADLIVAFFPIDRFLLGTFRAEFLKRPAAWFVPYELMIDPKTQDDFVRIVEPVYDAIRNKNPDKTGFLKAAMTAMAAPLCSAEEMEKVSKADQKALSDTDRLSVCGLKELLNEVSLNNIRVVVQGVMTVDVATVPATIYGVTFDEGNTSTIWTTKGPHTGSISGIYLTGGDIEAVNENGQQITNVTFPEKPDGSTDTNLKFSMTLSPQACVPSSTKVFFVVNKTGSGNSSKNSTTASNGNSSMPAKSTSTVSSTPFEVTPQPTGSCSSASDGNTKPASEDSANPKSTDATPDKQTTPESEKKAPVPK